MQAGAALNYAVFQSVPPAAEPVLLEEAKAQCHVYTDADDDSLNQYIAASREMTEKNTRRQLITATWVLSARRWPMVDYIELPRPPLQSVTSVQYLDLAGDLQTLSADDYVLVTAAPVGRIALKHGKNWPSALEQEGSISITYVAGYGDSGDDVPKLLKQAILMRVAHWYLNRESTVQATIASVPDGPARADGIMKSQVTLNKWWR